MTWYPADEVFRCSAADTRFDSRRATGPSVLQDDDGSLRMWYSGHDGTTARVLEAYQPRGRPWQRLGIAIDAGFAGASDAYGVESPSVVRTAGGLVMAYAGSDGENTRLHMATSVDGTHWRPHGPFLQREGPDAVGATHPCLVVTHDRWWLYYSGYDGRANGRAAVILAAVSDNGASWDRLGPLIEPSIGELAVTEPSVLLTRRRFVMFHVGEDDAHAGIELATSTDGLSWRRHGPIQRPGEAAMLDDARSPHVLRLHDGALHLWYALNDRADPSSYRLHVTELGSPLR